MDGLLLIQNSRNPDLLYSKKGGSSHQQSARQIASIAVTSDLFEALHLDR